MGDFVVRHAEEIDAPQLRSIDRVSPETRTVRQRTDPLPRDWFPGCSFATGAKWT